MQLPSRAVLCVTMAPAMFLFRRMGHMLKSKVFGVKITPLRFIQMRAGVRCFLFSLSSRERRVHSGWK